MVIGTSAVVQPAADLPFIAKENGAYIIEMNREATGLTNYITDCFIQGSVEETLPELLAISHMSKSNFLRVFRKATGLTPVEYLTNIRIQESMRLLTGTDFSMSEIASRVGFCDSNYFSRQFRRILGLTPRAYRKIHAPRLE